MRSRQTVSVIIPTHNRSSSIKRTLDMLSAQNYPLDLVEVIVIADGCTDETVQTLSQHSFPFSFCLLEQQGQGAAMARNTGEAIAKGELLIFLDDDIDASPMLVEAHVKAHQQNPNVVVIGYLPPVVSRRHRFFYNQLWFWWESIYQQMNRQDHRFAFNNLFSGNFSLPKSIFNKVGGFDTSFKVNEDYELGFRLIQEKIDFVFAPDAWGYHYDSSNLDRMIKRKYQEGRMGVQLVRKYPELIGFVNTKFFTSKKGGIITRVFFLRFPAVTDFIAASRRILLEPLEWFKMRRRWQRMHTKLLSYWYLRGIADELKDWPSIQQFLYNRPTGPGQDEFNVQIDLKEGLQAVASTVDNLRPSSLHVYYGNRYVGHIPAHPGCERLKGKHLRIYLSTTLAYPLLLAMSVDGIRTEDQLEKFHI